MISERLERGVRASNLLVDDPELSAYLRNVTCRSVGDLRCGELRIYILREPGFNAFMLPNGAMVVRTGLLLRLESEAELAAVLGHEASHYVRRHTLARWRKEKRTRATWAVLGSVVAAGGAVAQASTGSAGGWSFAGDAVAAAEIAAIYGLFAYGRKQEREADIDGIRWMTQGGYDARAAHAIWRKMADEQAASGDAGRFSLVSTHPAPKRRMKYLGELAAEMSGGERPPIAQAFAVRFAEHREAWLTDELPLTHPASFAMVAERQRALGFSAGLSAYMEARSWMRLARRGGPKERAGALSSALSAFRRGDAANDGMPAQAHREWGRALLWAKRPDLTAAQGQFNRYFELRPDAPDRSAIKSMMERRLSKRRR